MATREGEAGVSQTASWERPASPDRLGTLATFVVALGIIAGLGAIVFVLRADIANPSTSSCISVTAGAPALVLGRFLIRRRRRWRIREIRDARRGGISIGITRPRRERPGTDDSRPGDPARRSGRRRLDLRGSQTSSDDGRDVMIMEV
jgi:hypothetical protein